MEERKKVRWLHRAKRANHLRRKPMNDEKKGREVGLLGFGRDVSDMKKALKPGATEPYCTTLKEKISRGGLSQAEDGY